MEKKELMVENSMHALLRSALLLGEKRNGEPIRRITIAAKGESEKSERFACTILVEHAPWEATRAAEEEVEYAILYPAARF